MYDYAKGKCPNAYTASEEVISLPLHLYLSEDDIQKVISTVLKSIKI
jgi:dTDP-4-amino-4,6-dideoxygalactose transaminase